MNDSLGLVEVKGFCASIYTVDALLKNTSVSIDLEEINNGNVILRLKGPLPQINYAINLAVENANRISSVISSTILEKLNPTIEELFFNFRKDTRARRSAKPEEKNKIGRKSESEPRITEIDSAKNKPDIKAKHPSVAKSSKKISDEPEVIQTESKVSTIERLRLEALGKKSLSDTKVKKAEVKSVQHFNVKRLSDLEGLNVHKLRRAARDFDEFPIKGRQISMASREELVEYFKQILPE